MTLQRRAARWMLRQATAVLPAHRRQWADAMRAELQHLPDDHEALRWACGCLLASFKERVDTMVTGNLNISRWLLVPEMLLCFVPLSIGWIDAVFGGSGIIRLNADVIHRYFGGSAGTAMLTMMGAGAVLGIAGPVGLFSTLRCVALTRPLQRWLGAVLVAGPIALYVIGLLARYSIDSMVQVSLDGILLMCVLPALGAAHLLFIGRSWQDGQPLTAGLARRDL